MWRALAIAALVACGKGGGTTAGSGNAPGSSSGSGSAAIGSGSAAVGSAGAGSAVSPASDPVSAAVTAARCTEPCLFLVDTPIADLPTAYKAACNKDTADIGFDDCAAIDLARNCIYAAHGKVYKQKKWKRLYGKKSWYVAHPEWTEAAFTATEKANVKELYTRGKACKKGVHISAADRDRVKAWFAVVPKTPPMPPLVFAMQGEHVSGKEFVKQLVGFVSDDLKFNGKVDPATLSYAEIDSDAADMDFMKPLRDALPADRTGLRAVLVELPLPGGGSEDNPISEGVYIVLVYDAKDKLVGVALDHYLFD